MSVRFLVQRPKFVALCQQQPLAPIHCRAPLNIHRPMAHRTHSFFFFVLHSFYLFFNIRCCKCEKFLMKSLFSFDKLLSVGFCLVFHILWWSENRKWDRNGEQIESARNQMSLLSIGYALFFCPVARRIKMISIFFFFAGSTSLNSDLFFF